MHRREAGYTILELLIAVTLIATLSVLLTSGLHLGARIWQRSDHHREAWMDLVSGYQFLKGRFGAAVPVEAKSTNGARIVVFDGRSNEVAFVNSDLGKIGFLGNQLVTIRVEADGDSFRLVIYRRPYADALATTTGEGEKEILIDGITKPRFSYYGALQPGQAASWQAAWQNVLMMPQLIRLEFSTSSVAHASTWVFALPQS
jgi:general secretion pathway protein J